AKLRVVHLDPVIQINGDVLGGQRIQHVVLVTIQLQEDLPEHQQQPSQQNW
ncbi:MAG: hypothetical protein RI904_2473, partial [Pseudomonadota bacterium]